MSLGSRFPLLPSETCQDCDFAIRWRFADVRDSTDDSGNWMSRLRIFEQDHLRGYYNKNQNPLLH